VTESEIFTLLPCLNCERGQSVKVRSIIGAVYLHVERGEKVTIPPRDKLLTYCCRNLHATDGLTYLIPEATGRLPPDW
jgi:hypothetical protein